MDNRTAMELAVLRSELADAREDAEQLRELVREMWRLGFSEESGANSAEEWELEAEDIRAQMAELGVEVD